MALLPTTRKQLGNLIPEGTNTPTVPADLARAINAIEARLVQRATTVAAASDALTGFEPFEDGMLLVTTGGTAPSLHARHAGAWKRLVPTITASASAPSGGVDGDIHLQY